ncbi:hypothetical protein SLE2022_021820 [Rubroshorea leprosula]
MEVGGVLADCIQLARTMNDVSFTHCKLNGNHTAHDLARWAEQVNEEQTWVDEIPLCAYESMPNDKAHLN